MFRYLALALALFALLGAAGPSVPGLTAGAASACSDPSCQ
ncbi:hypothetical protein I41_25970 [Lacipirellula limnantheis]|uniref:Uncharacterized protein n=1 Tax=Lacipirellula limnantheis TaxID=2528024 RepID=A0A517TYE9_9BACT|nr:hypothetical protein I41_25970 [Lacipirellula limnantheis]